MISKGRADLARWLKAPIGVLSSALAVLVLTMAVWPRTKPVVIDNVVGSKVDQGPSQEGPWSPLAVMAVVDPRDYGAVGDGIADDHFALERAMSELGDAGGVIWIADGLMYRVNSPLEVGTDHIKFWSSQRQGGFVQPTDPTAGGSALWCRDADGCGFFGLKLISDARERLSNLTDHQIALDGAQNAEIVGLDIAGGPAAGIFSFGSSEGIRIEGNYIHNTFADSIHFTDGSRSAFVWGNTFFNEPPSLGDDGIACVTYRTAPRCGDMEWWNNSNLGNGHGRGIAVVGGDHINIHHNLIRDTAAAGILVASESGYDTSSSEAITIEDNIVISAAQVVSHSGILISGLNDRAEPISNVIVANNIVVDTRNGGAFRTEGNVTDIHRSGLSSDRSMLPSDLVGTGDEAAISDTSVLRTWDTSFVASRFQRGLYRIHIRRSTDGEFEQRFEYVVSADGEELDKWLKVAGAVETSGRFLVTYRGRWQSGEAGGNSEALVLLSSEPIVIPQDIEPIGFEELRHGDLDGFGSDLWRTLA